MAYATLDVTRKAFVADLAWPRAGSGAGRPKSGSIVARYEAACTLPTY